MKRQSGFTLIELIIVIVILGILAVTAAPQFFNFGGDARSSTVRGLEGSIKAASELVHARAQINPDAGEVEVRGGATVALNGAYAEASVDGIRNALSLGDDDWVLVVSTNVVEDDEIIAWRPASISEPTDNSWNIDGSAGCFAYYSWDNDGQTEPEIGSVTESC